MNKIPSAVILIICFFSLAPAEAQKFSPKAVEALANPPADGIVPGEARMEARAEWDKLFKAAIKECLPDLNPYTNSRLSINRDRKGYYWDFQGTVYNKERVNLKEVAVTNDDRRFVAFAGRRGGLQRLTVRCRILHKGNAETLEKAHRFVAAKQGHTEKANLGGALSSAGVVSLATSELTNFAGAEKAVYSWNCAKHHESLTWLKGNHLVTVTYNSADKAGGVKAVAGKVHAALEKHGFYKFPLGEEPAEEPPASGSNSKTLALKVTRPPVVLVHGLFSNPVECWVSTKNTGTSFYVLLEKSGFMPFAVNYEQSNGGPDSGPSTYQDNYNVVWDSPSTKPGEPYEHGWLKDEYVDGWLGIAHDKPALSIFQKPRQLNIGGIKQSLEYYRDELKIAATQADVIGHSMGGLLTRVWASPNYNKNYKRQENYNKGDILRMITICTPHHGTELASVKDVVQGAAIGEQSWTDWLRQKVTCIAVWWLLGKESGAISDLRNMQLAEAPEDKYSGAALRRIGKTDIPAFTIATMANDGEAAKNDFDPHSAYFHLYGGLGMMFFHNRPLLDSLIEQKAKAWNAAGQQKIATDFSGKPGLSNDSDGVAKYSDFFHEQLDHNVYYWAKKREGAYRDELKDSLENHRIIPYGDFEHNLDIEESWLGDPLATLSEWGLGGDLTAIKRVDKEPDVPYEMITLLRALIFNNDPENDGAVRVVSQIGDCAATETIPGILHSFSPWNYKVQRKCIDLLKWDEDMFSPEGIPPAGRALPHYLPIASFATSRVEGKAAIAWCGVVESHALAMAKLADEANAILIGRPVNHDSTALIADNAATKGMAIKGKSSDWGPQRGLIARDQKFSKIWQIYKDKPDTRKKQIDKYNGITEEMLKEGFYPKDPENPHLEGRLVAVSRPLVVPAGTKQWEVLIDPKEQDAEKAIYLKLPDSESYYSWHNDGDGGFDREKEVGDDLKLTLSEDIAQRLVPMEVIADGLSDAEPKPYLTADYDLLTIAFHNSPDFHGTPQEVVKLKEGDPDELRGYISTRQKHLVKKINDRVKASGYKGGNVTHHGPENQYPGSPYIDYPLIVYDPGDPEVKNDQKVFAIPKGPPGFRDIHLKRYFAEKIRDKFNLYPNPDGKGWLWESWRKFDPVRGYDPRDAADLAPYVDEAPWPEGYERR